MYWNLINDKGFGSLFLLKLKYRKGDPIIQTFCTIGPPPREIRSPLFNLQKFQKSYKINPESCRMHWNLMNDEEFRSLNLLKLKYRRRDQIIQSFCRPGSPQKLVPPSLICGNLKSLGKALVNHAECFKI